MRDDRRDIRLARLDEAQRRSRERLRLQQQRIDARFERLRSRMLASEERPSDDQRRIITAALELLDEVGLNELSLRKLAAKLNLKAPALYWHFKNKEELIDYMAEAILSEEFADLTPRAQDEPWQDWTITLCKRLRKAMLGYRDGGRIVTGAHFFPAITLVRLFETSAQSLTSAGVEEVHAELIVSTAVHFTFGRVIEEQSGPEEDQVRKVDFAAMQEAFPYLMKSIERIQKAGNLEQLSDEEFEESLRLIIRD